MEKINPVIENAVAPTVRTKSNNIFHYGVKNAMRTILTDNFLFPAFLIVIIGVVSYGLGRFSAQYALEPEKFQVKQDIVYSSVNTEETITSNGSAALGSAELPGAYGASKNSDKYHLPWCPGASTISEGNKIWFKDKAEAEGAGYKPAKNCKGI